MTAGTRLDALAGLHQALWSLSEEPAESRQPGDMVRLFDPDLRGYAIVTLDPYLAAKLNEIVTCLIEEQNRAYAVDDCRKVQVH